MHSSAQASYASISMSHAAGAGVALRRGALRGTPLKGKVEGRPKSGTGRGARARPNLKLRGDDTCFRQRGARQIKTN